MGVCYCCLFVIFYSRAWYTADSSYVMQPKCNVNECVKIDSKFHKSVGEKRKKGLLLYLSGRGSTWIKNVCLDDIGFTK